jgi:hypothetical protein
MKRVRILTEDKTGGGLEAVIKAEVNRQRSVAGKEPLAIDPNKGFVTSNGHLLRMCDGYGLFRFGRQRYDHVVYVLDARNCWEACHLDEPHPPHSQDSLRGSLQQVREHMLGRAKSGVERWSKELEEGFHAHVLVWERESLMLPVGDRLGLGAAHAHPYEEMQAAEWIGKRFRSVRRDRAYAKSTHGPGFLKQIAESDELRAIVVGSNPSLAAIVSDLVSID